MATETSRSFSLEQAFFEAFFVLLDVALAMAANAWWESTQKAKRAAASLEAIQAEIERNLTLSSAHPRRAGCDGSSGAR